MGLRPILSSLLRSKTGPLLVALQIAVTLAIVINSLFIIVPAGFEDESGHRHRRRERHRRRRARLRRQLRRG